jgi:multidrug efflux pump subunit AcrA (membrane-fusion protein)
MELVFVVNEGKARLRIVKTGKRIGDDLELVSGVDAGESIVVENASVLADGQPLQVR